MLLRCSVESRIRAGMDEPMFEPRSGWASPLPELRPWLRCHIARGGGKRSKMRAAQSRCHLPQMRDRSVATEGFHAVPSLLGHGTRGFCEHLRVFGAMEAVSSWVLKRVRC
jgi:hypothetical protein